MGFRFAETMSGTYAPIDQPERLRPFTFSMEAEADSTLRHLRDGKAVIRGTLEAEGLANFVPIEGVLTMLPWTKKFIRYEFTFTGDDGEQYRFEGQKDIRFLDLARSFTELPGAVYDMDDNAVATAMTRFDARADLFPFLASWKPT